MRRRDLGRYGRHQDSAKIAPQLQMENIREKRFRRDILYAFPEMLTFAVGWREIMGIVRYNILRITHFGRGPNRLVIGITETGPYSRPWLRNVDELPIVSQKDHHFISGV